MNYTKYDVEETWQAYDAAIERKESQEFIDQLGYAAEWLEEQYACKGCGYNDIEPEGETCVECR